MKPRFSNKRNEAMTLVEALVVIAVLIVLTIVFLPAVDNRPIRAPAFSCINHLKEIGLAYRIWAGDNNDKYPMEISITNGGAMELIAAGNVAACFQVMSNELSTPKNLYCMADTDHSPATNFTTDFNNSHVSYFVGLDAGETRPQMILSGDDNFEIGGVPIKSGLLELPTNTSVTWSSGRHILENAHFWTLARNKFFGNIGFADGSVQQVTQSGLRQALQKTGVATNRLAIP